MRGAPLAVASAALLLIAAPPLALTPLVLLALVPLLIAARRASGAAAAAALGWIAGAVFHAGLLPWLPATIARALGVTAPAAAAWAALYVAFHALQLALAAAGARLGCSPATRAGATAAAWVLLEAGFPQVLPWSLGAALGPHPLLRQAADLGGARGLAALAVAVNALVAEAVAGWSADRARAGGVLAAAALLLVAAAGYGSLAGAATGIAGGRGQTPAASIARIAVVQAGGAAADAAEPQAAATAAWSVYAGLSERAGGADVVVWPEGVLRVYLRDSPAWRARAAALARRLRSALVIGALDRAPGGGELTAAYVFAPALAAVAPKAVLVPFGEYLPGAARRSPLRAWRPPAARRSGAPPAPVAVAGRRLASSICFEAILPGHFNDAVRDGAELLVNLSDDSWFASRAAAAQHLEMTRLRAVETRRWLVRASHSGISAFIAPDGAIVAALPYGQRGTLRRTAAPGRRLTPYVRWGDAPLLALAAAALLLAAVGRAGRSSQP